MIESHLIVMPKPIQELLLSAAVAVEQVEASAQITWKTARADGALLGYGLGEVGALAATDALRKIAVKFIGSDRGEAMAAAKAVTEAMKMVCGEGAEVAKNSAADEKNGPGKTDFEGSGGLSERNSAKAPTTVPDWQLEPVEPRKLAPGKSRAEREAAFQHARARLASRGE